MARSSASGSFFLASVLYTTKADSSRTVASRRHQKIFLMFIQTIRLREIPDWAQRAVGRSPANNRSSGMGVAVFVCPLRDITLKVQNPERTRTCGKLTHIRGRVHGGAIIHSRKPLTIPVVSPRIQPIVRRLGGILPLPFVRKTLTGPDSVSAGILDGNPRDGFVLPSFQIGAIFPIT